MYTTFFILPPRNFRPFSTLFLQSYSNRVCMCVFMCVCVCISLLTIILKRVYYDLSLCTYVCMYVSCVSRFLFIRSSFISLLFRSLSRNAQWQSVEIDVFYLELVLLFFVLRRILELARQCWLTRAAGRLSIDVEESTMKRVYYLYFVTLNNNLTI